MKQKWDLHVHTRSTDSNLTAKETIETYINYGYHGIIVTDHYDSYRLNALDSSHLKSLKRANNIYKNGYYELLKESKNYDNFTVLLGMEYTMEFNDFESHILVFSEDLENILDTTDIKPYLSIYELKNVVGKNSILIEQL